MRTFRLVLTLLLCLTVPMAGWASLLSGPLCPQASHPAPSSESHEHPVETPAVHQAGDHAHDQGCADAATTGKPCKGDHCGCGCGMGACSTPSLSLTTPFSPLLAVSMGAQALPMANDSPHAAARIPSALRPPIG